MGRQPVDATVERDLLGHACPGRGPLHSRRTYSLTKQPEARRRVRDGLALVAPATSVPTGVTGQPGLFHALSSETQRGRPTP